MAQTISWFVFFILNRPTVFWWNYARRRVNPAILSSNQEASGKIIPRVETPGLFLNA